MRARVADTRECRNERFRPRPVPAAEVARREALPCLQDSRLDAAASALCRAYFGGGAVLLARDPNDPSLWLPPHKGVSEVVNDINGRLINFWRVLRDEEAFPRFVRMAQAIPLARAEWQAAHAHVHAANDPVADALAFFVDCRQSRSGLMKGFTPVTRSRTRREMNGNVSEWLSAVRGVA